MFSLSDVDLSCNVSDVVAGEGAAGVELVAAGALHAADQLAHVRGEVVLGRAVRVQGRHTENEPKNVILLIIHHH